MVWMNRQCMIDLCPWSGGELKEERDLVRALIRRAEDDHDQPSRSSGRSPTAQVNDTVREFRATEDKAASSMKLPAEISKSYDDLATFGAPVSFRIVVSMRNCQFFLSESFLELTIRTTGLDIRSEIVRASAILGKDQGKVPLDVPVACPDTIRKSST